MGASFAFRRIESNKMNTTFRAIVFAVAFAASLPAFSQSIFAPTTAGGGTGTGAAGGTTGAMGAGAAGGADTRFDLIDGPPMITNRARGFGATGTGIATPDRMRPDGTQLRNGPAFAPPPDYKDRVEFQDFVLQATGRDLPVFGAKLFQGAPSTFAPVDNVPVTADYTLGPGDEVVIRAWGQIDVDYSAIIDRNGNISIPKVGNISVAGIKYQNLSSYLKTVFGRTFRNFELTATLGELRSIQIFVVGQAKRPGTYTVSSLSSLVTALFAVGGPSARGSMRRIQLKRGNAIVTELDLYDLLVSGNKSKDAALLPGDVIYIPPVGNLVAISGSVNVPAIYEIKGSTALSDLVAWAGGLSTVAQGQKATVERIDQRRARVVDEFALDSGGMSRALHDGDLVTVYALTQRFDNAITLRGNVAQPGRFPWREGMRIRDLIPSREALISQDYWLRQGQLVGMDPNVTRILQDQEPLGIKLTVPDLIERPLRDAQDVTVGEAIRRRQIERDAGRIVDRGDLVRQPFGVRDPTRGTLPDGTVPLEVQPNQQPTDPVRTARDARDKRAMETGTDPTRLVNQITPSLRAVNWDYAVIERMNPNDLTTGLVPFNLGKAVIDADPSQNLLLRPGDVVTIFSREDIQVQRAKQTEFIRLEGEFANSGVYQILPGETLRQLVQRVGGLAPGAYLFGAEFTRESTRLMQQKNLTEALNKLEQDIQRTSATRAQNVVAAEDAGTIKQQADSQQALIARLRQIRPTGRIVIEVPETAQAKDLPDLPLENGDRFYIPSMPSMVNVFGSVYSENSFIYKPDKRLNDYLAQAGGPTRFADKNSIYVARADGSVVSTRQSSSFFSFGGGLDAYRPMPGDSIVVPEELDKTTTTRMLRDISQIFYQFGLGAAAIRVLKQ